MKITLNLTLRASARDRYALAWALPATLAGLTVLVLLGRASRKEYRDYREIQNRVAEVEKRAAQLQEQEAAARRKLDYPGYREVLRQAGYVNNLIAQREVSMAALSARLAGLLPEDAHLTGLQLDPPRKLGEDFTVRMGITAKGEDPVETFINDLEDSPDFKDVAIINQGFEEENLQGQQVNLICTARYLPDAERTVEETSQEPDNGAPKPEAESPRSETGEHKAPAQKRQEAASAKKGTARPGPAAGNQRPAATVPKTVETQPKLGRPGAE